MFFMASFCFFQAEDGIRDSSVTGVQTCALPISTAWPAQGRKQKPRQPAGLVRIERDRGLRLLAVPDAEACMVRFGQVHGDAQSAVPDIRMSAEVLDDLRALRLAAVRAEAELVL